MFNNLAFFHLWIINRFLLYNHSGACGFLGPGKGEITNKTEREQKYSNPKFLHCEYLPKRLFSLHELDLQFVFQLICKDIKLDGEINVLHKAAVRYMDLSR